MRYVKHIVVLAAAFLCTGHASPIADSQSTTSHHGHEKRDLPPEALLMPIVLAGGFFGYTSWKSYQAIQKKADLLADCLSEAGRYPALLTRTMQQRLETCCQLKDIDLTIDVCEKLVPPGFARVLKAERAARQAREATNKQKPMPFSLVAWTKPPHWPKSFLEHVRTAATRARPQVLKLGEELKVIREAYK
ncbi:MAG: hypothetical protein M1826_000793 [Phylliscum demangeonii]|nr:MAG: hypothetical protein M1826_000793 [Phylliscum demangeonii]